MKKLNLTLSHKLLVGCSLARTIPVLLLTLLLASTTLSAQEIPPDGTTTTTGAVANAAQQTVPAKSVVRGRAVYDDTNRPVRRTRVTLLELNKDFRVYTGMTNASGEFQIKDVPAGTYVVMFEATGLITPLSFVDIDDKSERFNFAEIRKHFEEVIVDGNRDVTVKVRAKRGGAISGRVTYSDGDIAVNVRVSIMRKKDGRLSRFVSNLNATSGFGTQTDDRGMYRLAGLAPGDYVVSVSETLAHDRDKDSQRGEYMDMFGGSSMAVTYYKSTKKSGDATVVKIDLGQDQNEINISMADRILHTVSGSVVTRNGSTPLLGATVSITSKDDAFAGSTFTMPISIQTDEEGVFTFSELPDGEYNLKVDPPYFSDNVGQDTSEEEPTSPSPPVVSQRKKLSVKKQDLSVSGSDITDLTIRMSEGVSVSGTVTVDGAYVIPADTFVRLDALNRESAFDSNPVERDGRFRIEGLASGAFSANVRSASGSHFYVKAISNNETDLMSDPLLVEENADISDVRVVISGDGATLSGRVLNADNIPANGTAFVLIPSDQRKWRARATFLHGNSNSDGSYQVGGAPGDYLVIFLRDSDHSQAINETWIRSRSTTAGRVTLMPNERKNLDLIMPRP